MRVSRKQMRTFLILHYLIDVYQWLHFQIQKYLRRRIHNSVGKFWLIWFDFFSFHTILVYFALYIWFFENWSFINEFRVILLNLISSQLILVCSTLMYKFIFDMSFCWTVFLDFAKQIVSPFTIFDINAQRIRWMDTLYNTLQFMSSQCPRKNNAGHLCRRKVIFLGHTCLEPNAVKFFKLVPCS